MPMLADPDRYPPPPFIDSTGIFQNSTIRQTIPVSLDAPKIRVRISNTFGTVPLLISHVSIGIAPQGGSPIFQPDTLRKVTFSNIPSITIPIGALVVSDPIDVQVARGDHLSVSIYLEAGQSGFDLTCHPGSLVDSWLALGNQTSSPNLSGSSVITIRHWYYLSAIEGYMDSG